MKLIPEYPVDVPRGWLARELAFYRRFGIEATAKTPYAEIHKAIVALPKATYEEFMGAWLDLCMEVGAEQRAKLWEVN